MIHKDDTVCIRSTYTSRCTYTARCKLTILYQSTAHSILKLMKRISHSKALKNRRRGVARMACIFRVSMQCIYTICIVHNILCKQVFIKHIYIYTQITKVENVFSPKNLKKRSILLHFSRF